MSYDVQIFRKEVKANYAKNYSSDFFEKTTNFVEFTDEQYTYIKNTLDQHHYTATEDDTFVHNQEAATILLKKSVVYCSANTSKGIDALFNFIDTILTDKSFLRFDPQDMGWD